MSSDSEDDKMKNFLSNLSDVGELCHFDDVNNVENPLFAGKIVKILPFKSNRAVRGTSTMIFVIKEVIIDAEASPKKFRVIFVGESAEVMEQSELKIKDYLAISKPKFFRDSSYSLSASAPRNPVLIVGIELGNQIPDIFGRGNAGEDWYRVTNISTKSRRLVAKPLSRLTFSKPDRVQSKRIIESSDEEDELIVTNPIEKLSDRSSSTSTSDGDRGIIESQDDEDSTVPITKISSDRCSFTSRSGSSDVGLRVVSKENSREQGSNLACFHEDAADDGDYHQNTSFDLPSTSRGSTSIVTGPDPIAGPSTKSVKLKHAGKYNHNQARYNVIRALRKNVSDSPLIIENVRLKDVRENMKVTVFGVIVSNGKEPTNKECRTRIVLADETNKKFSVDIYTMADEVMPTIRRFDLVKLTDMEVKCNKSQPYGVIKFAKNIVTYSREEPSQLYKCSGDDRRRVDELICWMQENLPEARMYTFISNIRCISANIHLCGHVVKKKFFINSSIILIRLRDGTRTNEYFYNYDMTSDLLTIHSDGPPSKGLDFVDIIILDADKTFCKRIKSLQIDSAVRLYDVQVKPEAYKYKTNVRYSIKLFFKAVHQNLETFCVPKKQPEIENEYGEFNQLSASSARKDELSRRELLNSDESVSLDAAEVDSALRKKASSVRPPDEDNRISPASCKPCSVRIPRLTDVEIPVLHSPVRRSQRISNERPSTKRAMSCDNDVTTEKNLYLKSLEFEKIIERNIANQNIPQIARETEYLEEWPVDMENEFWMKVTLVSMIPVITKTSSEMDVISLIQARCERCKSCVPFFATKWVHKGSNVYSFCSMCKEEGFEVRLCHTMIADLLLEDSCQEKANAIIEGSIAEKFFGYTISELIDSKTAQFSIRKFVNTSKNLTLKLKVLKRNERGITYRVLDTE